MADFFGAGLRGSRFERASPSGSVFFTGSLAGSQFRGVDLSGVVMRGVELELPRLYALCAERDLDALAGGGA